MTGRGSQTTVSLVLASLGAGVRIAYWGAEEGVREWIPTVVLLPWVACEVSYPNLTLVLPLGLKTPRRGRFRYQTPYPYSLPSSRCQTADLESVRSGCRVQIQKARDWAPFSEKCMILVTRRWGSPQVKTTYPDHIDKYPWDQMGSSQKRGPLLVPLDIRCRNTQQGSIILRTAHMIRVTDRRDQSVPVCRGKAELPI